MMIGNVNMYFSSLTDSWKSKKSLWILLVLLVLAPVGVWAVLQKTFIAPRALSLPIIATVKIDPGQITTRPNGPAIHMSALAVDANGNHVNDMRYQWGISSTNSIGTVVQEQGNDKLATFTPSKNIGQGDIWVRAVNSRGLAMGSVPAFVGVPPWGSITPTPTPPPGCYYRQVECFQAPCPPELVCPTPTPSGRYRVSWSTQFASLFAEDFKILAGEKTFYGRPDLGTTVSIGSDPPAPGENYTTLEVTWREQGVEMRLFIYFYKDNQNWWASEMRTYNGKPYNPSLSQYPDWIYYYGPFFRTPLSYPYKRSDSFAIPSSPNNSIRGSIAFSGLTLQAFTTISATPSPTLFCPSPRPCPVPYIYGDSGFGGCPRYFCPVTPTPTPTISPTPTPTPGCIGAQPQLNFDPQLQKGKPDETLVYKVNIKNLDIPSCASTRFYLSVDPKAGWNTQLSQSYVVLAPGEAETVTLSITSPSNAPVGQTSFGVRTIGPKPIYTSFSSVIYEVDQPNVVKSLEFLIKFGGVTDGAAEGAGVTARFIKNDINVVTPPIKFTHTGNGVYKAVVGLTGSLTIPAGPGYTIVLKGEKHVARKFCKQSGQTAPCLGNESMTLPAGTPTPILDFTGLTLDPGDLPPQDGKADTSDFDKIKLLLSKPCSTLTEQDKKTADLDYNGCIDIGDAFLMRNTLETRYDEN